MRAKAPPGLLPGCARPMSQTQGCNTETERALAQRVLAEVPLRRFPEEPLIPPEQDEVSRLT